MNINLITGCSGHLVFAMLLAKTASSPDTGAMTSTRVVDINAAGNHA